MKGNGKNPTRNQKILMNKAGLNLEEWLVRREDKSSLYLIHRKSSREKVISRLSGVAER